MYSWWGILIACVVPIHVLAALHQGAPGQMIWPEYPQPWLPPCILLCFASVIVWWTENKNFTVSSRRPLCFILTVNLSGVGGLCVLRATTKKVVNFFEEKSGWPASRMFWPRNDLAPLLRWRRHCFSLSLAYCIFASYCVPFYVLLDGVWLSINKRITYLLTYLF